MKREIGRAKAGGRISSTELKSTLRAYLQREQHDTAIVDEVFGAMLELHNEGRKIDHLTVSEMLRQRGHQGDLLAVSWFDKFGIQRTAVDRGIVEQEDKLEGTFVVFLDGDSA